MTTKLIQHFINGKVVSGQSTAVGEVFNPATGEQTAKVLFATASDVDFAVNAADQAFPKWAATPPLRRARILFKFKELLHKNSNEIAKLITSEHGKVLDDALGELTRGIEVVEFACGIPHLLKGEFSENVGTDVDSYSMRQSLGVCAGISPFNFPAMVPMWMFPVALACGNTFVLKPSEKDPSTAMFLAELLREAGLPDGVFNVVNGDKIAVDALLNHPKVAAISFVGSTPIAEYIYKTGTSNFKRVQALGGAKNHCIVMPDADLELVVDGIMGAAYGSAGERCMALSIALAVGDATADQLIAALKERIAKLKVGPGTDSDSQMGPLVTKQHFEKVVSYVDLGVKEGAKLVVDGRGINIKDHEKGYFLGPCLFDNVQTNMKIYQEEIFGPVLGVVRVKDFDTAIELINKHKFGNGTAIFTNSGAAARHFASKIQVGMVGINVPIPVPMAFYSFGGWKSSIYGDYAIHGAEGIRFYTKLKTITSRWPKEALTAEFIMPTMK